ncbi:hypothetical protein [Streptomyces sp. NBC_01276]|uniref:hypothetical protein n=1 Tax=Streptomyces sp. NBC_01276 TaxID=2903808 RepID=UPI002F909638
MATRPRIKETPPGDPPRPPRPHLDDVAALAGVSPSTIRADATTGLLDPGIDRHGRRWWTRAAAEARTTRPAQHNGRTPAPKTAHPGAPHPTHGCPRSPPPWTPPRTAPGPPSPRNPSQPATASARTAERLLAKACATTG